MSVGLRLCALNIGVYVEAVKDPCLPFDVRAFAGDFPSRAVGASCPAIILHPGSSGLCKPRRMGGGPADT